ncbi:MAG: hypothetical protein HZA79_11075 [Sphingobacteriales bacterium]|nr:hypothetical protein [Sphingobacteriales bacterium]
MKYIPAFILAFVIIPVCYSQELQGDWTNKLNNGICNENGFSRYKWEIRISNDSFHYSNYSIKVNSCPEELKGIYTRGIFHPGLLYGDTSCMLITNQHYSFAIGATVAAAKMDSSGKKRSYKIWVFRGRIANPFEYELILENRQAGLETNQKEFIEKAILVCIRFITIII